MAKWRVQDFCFKSDTLKYASSDTIVLMVPIFEFQGLFFVSFIVSIHTAYSGDGKGLVISEYRSTTIFVRIVNKYILIKLVKFYS
jgi:hypothetical protein